MTTFATEIRLDYPKWRAALDEAMAKKDARVVTQLHDIRAHINGKQHRKRARIDWSDIQATQKMSQEEAWKLAQNGGSAIFDLSLPDQAYFVERYAKSYLGPKWEDFTCEVTVQTSGHYFSEGESE